MLPLSGGIPARRFPIVNVFLIVANFAVRIFYELPQQRLPRAGGVEPQLDHCHVSAWWLGSHPGQHAVPGDLRKNVEDAFGSLLYLVFYFAGGFAAMMTQTAMTLLFGTAAEARVPELGASGAITAVLGAYFVLYPGSRIRTWIFLGLWFSYQLIEASFGLFSASASGGGVAFFAHVGGFIFGLLVARLLARTGQAAPVEQRHSAA